MLTYLIVLLPILYQLKSPLDMISLGELLLIPFMIKCIIKEFANGKKKISIPKNLIVFYFVPIFITIFASFNTFFNGYDAITVIIRIVFYFILILLARDYFDIKKGMNIYFILTVICSLYLFLQVIAHEFVGVELPIPANYSHLLKTETIITDVNRYYSHYGFRPASLFVEPSYYADFFMPMIFLLLFSEDIVVFNRKLKNFERIIITLIFSFSVILSTSSLGIVYLIIAWGIFIFMDLSKMHVHSYTRIIVIFIAVISLVYIFNSSIFDLSLRRLANGSSIGARVIRGFIIFGKLNIYQKIFGVGLNNIGNFVRSKNISTIYDEANLNYTVTLTNRLIATGIMGTLSLIYFVVSEFFNKSKAGKAMIIAMLISFVFANGEYTYGFAFFYIWLMQINKRQVV